MLNIAKHKAAKESSTPHPSHAVTPLEDMERYFSELGDRMFDGRWFQPILWPGRTFSSAPFEGRAPHVDVIDRDDTVLVKAELPGIEKKDIDISMSDSTIILKAEYSHEEKKEDKGEYYRQEISHGSYSRSIALPAAIDIDKARATLKDGVLELTLPKIEKTTRKKVEVE